MRTITDDGRPFAILVEDPGGGLRYLITPVVIDARETCLLGLDGAAMIAEMGAGPEIPVLTAGPADIPAITNRLAELRRQYQAAPWPPGTGT